jgi:hypothetical protein
MTTRELKTELARLAQRHGVDTTRRQLPWLPQLDLDAVLVEGVASLPVPDCERVVYLLDRGEPLAARMRSAASGPSASRFAAGLSPVAGRARTGTPSS